MAKRPTWPIPPDKVLRQSLRAILSEIDRLPCALQWNQFVASGRAVNLTELEFMSFQNACVDTTLISLRLWDEFFRTRRAEQPNPKPRRRRHLKHAASNHDIYAEQFGHVQNKPVLTLKRRSEINEKIAHLTKSHFGKSVTLNSATEIKRLLPFCIQFLDHVLKSNLLTHSHTLRDKTANHRDLLKGINGNPRWGMIASYALPETIHLGTLQVIEWAQDPFAKVYAQLVKMAARVKTSAPSGTEVLLNVPLNSGQFRQIITALETFKTKPKLPPQTKHVVEALHAMWVHLYGQLPPDAK